MVCAWLVFSPFMGQVLAGQERPRALPGRTANSSVSVQLATDLNRLRDAALEDEYGFKQLVHLTENIGSRISGSPQAEQAARYVADELKKLGLEVRLEEVKVPHWVRGT